METKLLGSWVKSFTDGSKEDGPDYLINAGQASWSKGKLSNITEVFLSFGFYAATLVIPNTQWHQFDRYSIKLGEDDVATRKYRYIQAQIQKAHVGLYLCYNNGDIRIRGIHTR